MIPTYYLRVTKPNYHAKFALPIESVVYAICPADRLLLGEDLLQKVKTAAVRERLPVPGLPELNRILDDLAEKGFLKRVPSMLINRILESL